MKHIPLILILIAAICLIYPKIGFGRATLNNNAAPSGELVPIHLTDKNPESLMDMLAKTNPAVETDKLDEKVEKSIASKNEETSVTKLENSQKSESNILSAAKNSNIPWIRAGLAFLFVSSLILLLGSFIQNRLPGAKTFLRPRENPLKVLQTASVGLKKQIAVLEFEGTKILVGVSGTGLQFLYSKAPEKVLEAAKEVKEVKESIKQTPADFEKTLNQETITQAYETGMKIGNSLPNVSAESFARRIRQTVSNLKPLNHTAPNPMAKNEYRSRELAPEFHPEKNNPIAGPKGPSFSRDKPAINGYS